VDKKSRGCDISIRIGGEAGQGMRIISSLLGKASVRSGLWVFTFQDIMSRIRGGHNFTQLRLSDRPVRSPSSKVDILVCLDKNTLELYQQNMQGFIIYDPGKFKENPPLGEKYLAVPLEEMANKIGGDARMANSVASGAVLGLLGLTLDSLFSLIADIFSEKGDQVIQANKKCAQSGYDLVKEKYKGLPFCQNFTARDQHKKMLLTGSEAIALAAIASNIRFYSGYPMSPATPIMEYLAAKKKKYGLIVEQAEDEIAAINMAIGAFFGGARSMTGTSGGGLALMVEGISLAGMTETPIVIADCQRPAPATGFPTRTEQADLLYVAHAGHGEFPRAIFAPSTAEDAFDLTNKAFYLAEKYQTPVFILGDQYLNDSAWTADKFSLKGIIPEKQSLLSGDELKNISAYQYRRYRITDSGISPRILPGTPNQVLYADSDEHTEEGHITESGEVRRMMVEKRLRKLSGLYQEIQKPKIYPDKRVKEYIVSWGSTLGIIEEAVSILNNEGLSIGFIHFSEVYPLREDAIPNDILKNARLVAVENNATAQFARLLRMETGVEIKDRILKYDGRPFYPQDVAEEIKKLKR
jgi:2-oxoglutarate ferredoxin oxidoreductase subunit alpha